MELYALYAYLCAMFGRNSIIRYLSVLLTLVVWTLSTLPCCVMDSCICQECECSAHDSGDEALPCDCCSPFIHCNTCPGCTVPASTPIIGLVEPQPESKIPLYHEDKYLSRYASSIWQPPKA